MIFQITQAVIHHLFVSWQMIREEMLERTAIIPHVGNVIFKENDVNVLDILLKHTYVKVGLVNLKLH